jgi:hypothetical protein
MIRVAHFKEGGLPSLRVELIWIDYNNVYWKGTTRFVIPAWKLQTPPLRQSLFFKAGKESNKFIFSSQEVLEKYY